MAVFPQIITDIFHLGFQVFEIKKNVRRKIKTAIKNEAAFCYVWKNYLKLNKSLFIICLSVINYCYAQECKAIKLYVNTVNGFSKHAWLLKQNEIFNDCGEFIRILTDNGSVNYYYDSSDYYNANLDSNIVRKSTLWYCTFTPNRLGKVNLKGLIRNWNGDTVQFKVSFQVIKAPDVRIKIIRNSFRKDSSFLIDFFDAKTDKKLSNRYERINIFSPILYNSNDSALCVIGNFTLKKIDFKNGFNDCSYFYKTSLFNKGNKIKFKVCLRDKLTDLEFYTNLFVFKID